MRRLLLLLACSLALTTLVARAAPFEATFNETQPASIARSNGHSHVENPCDPDAFLCGTGTIGGFGSASDQWFLTGGEQISKSCYHITFERFITLDDGSTLSTSGEGTACTPGNSTNTNGAFKSWGNPTHVDGTFEVVDGTGVFEGATGGGTETIDSAGAYATSQLSGDVEIP